MCSEHGRLCAYTGREADRCPWCHCRWDHVIATGVHSCESYELWRGYAEPRRRVVRAGEMRREAAITVHGRPAQDRPGTHSHRGAQRPPDRKFAV